MGCACDLLPVGDEKPDPATSNACSIRRTDGIIIGAFDPLLRQLELEWSRYAVVKIDSAFMLPKATLVATTSCRSCGRLFSTHSAWVIAGSAWRWAGGGRGHRSRYSAGYYVAREELELSESHFIFPGAS